MNLKVLKIQLPISKAFAHFIKQINLASLNLNASFYPNIHVLETFYETNIIPKQVDTEEYMKGEPNKSKEHVN